MKTLVLAWRIARRELRGGLAGFRVFLACLALGVGAIAAVGTVRESIRAGLAEQGAVLLGGDARVEFSYRLASDEERAWIESISTAVSEIVDFRSMVVVGEGDAAERGLTQVKAVDGAYPLLGEVVLDPPMLMEQALAGSGDLPGAVMDGVLMDRLGLAPGSQFRLGTQAFVVSARLVREPDSATGGFTLGPRTIVATPALASSGLLEPGTLFESAVRMRLPAGADLSALEAEAKRRFEKTGLDWDDRRNGAPGATRFIERLGSFLVLVGLAGLAVGGVGVSAAVRAYLARKVAVIATLKTLGAEARMVFAVYLMQVGVLTALGIVLGLILGAGLPVVFGPLLAERLPLPADFRIYTGPLLEAALYGFLTALIFTLWPLARAARVRAAELYREASVAAAGRPDVRLILVTAALLALLLAAAVAFSGVPGLALGTAGGIAGALVLLALAAVAVRALARRAAQGRFARGRVALRLALGAVGGPSADAQAVVLSLGLGLSVLAAVGQIDANLRSAIARDLPEVAPSYFFVDIQPDQIDAFRDRVSLDPAVSKVEAAPMLRGILTRINGRDASEVAGEHWVLRGDRGVTYADTLPEGTKITAGTFWKPGHAGPPELSFAAEEAAELGLKLGDSITVNVLGRDIEAKITSLREVDFSTAGMGFVMMMSPDALAGAPHSWISTVYAEPQAEAQILRDVAGAMPNVTAIRVRDAIDRVTEAMEAIGAAIRWAAGATLLTGFVVLIGAAAAGEPARVYEAAVLKTLGATRGRILASFALRSALLGAAAGVVAVIAGAAGAFAVSRLVMDTAYVFAPGNAAAIILGGIAATVLAGLAFALRPLAARPAQVLRGVE